MDQKLLFRSAVVLSDGVYNGDRTYLDPIGLVAVSKVYSYFTDFQIPHSIESITE